MAGLLPPERDFGVPRTPRRAVAALFGIFAVLLIAGALVERIGMDSGFVPVAVLGAALTLFALIALVSQSRRAVDFHVADRRIRGVFGGLAAASVFAGLLALGILGGAYATRPLLIASAAGFAFGFLLLAVFIAPSLRWSGAASVGDFLDRRFGSAPLRLAMAAVAVMASLALFIAQLQIASELLSMLTGLDARRALLVTAGLTALPAFAGGIRSLTWTQAVQYLVALLACLVPAAFLTASGEAPVDAEFRALLLHNLWTMNADLSELSVAFLFAALGAAALPPLLSRTLAAVSPRGAALSMMWAALLAVALFAASLIFWQAFSQAAGGMVETMGGSGLLQLATLFAALPEVLGGLVLAGAFAALLAVGQAALLSAATSLSHDALEAIDPRGPETLRIVLARIVVVVLALGVAALLSARRADAGGLTQWALAFAAAGGLPPLLLGLRWKRCSDIGALSGCLAGFGVALLAFLAERGLMGGSGGLGALGAPAAALAGTAFGFAVAIVVSLVMPAEMKPKDERGAGQAPAPQQPA